MKIVIEKDIPIPEPKRGNTKGRRQKNTITSRIEAMSIGDSIFFKGKSRNAAKSNTVYARKNLGFEFIARTVEGGARIWRIK